MIRPDGFVPLSAVLYAIRWRSSTLMTLLATFETLIQPSLHIDNDLIIATDSHGLLYIRPHFQLPSNARIRLTPHLMFQPVDQSEQFMHDEYLNIHLTLAQWNALNKHPSFLSTRQNVFLS
jgi:hypothetical protein